MTMIQEERLARIRRNQQNSRDRKRARLLELEHKVQELQDQVVSQPSLTSNFASWSTRVDALMQENAALRRLLHAVGVDDRGQTQFLQATIQYSKPESKQSLSLKAEKPLEHAHGSLERSSPPQLPVAVAKSDGDISTTWFQQNENLKIHHQDLSADVSPAQPMISTSADYIEPFGDWLVDFDGLSNATATDPLLTKSVSALQTSPSDDPFLGMLSSTSQNRQPFPKTGAPTPSFEVTWQSAGGPDEFLSTASCLLNASVPVSESDSTTLCSIALQMVFQHNKKRLTMSELDQKLRCGFRKASEPAQECRVENHVLFNVLAEICV